MAKQGAGWSSFFRRADARLENEHKLREAALKLADEACELGAYSEPSIHQLLDLFLCCPGDASLHRLIEEALQPYRRLNVLMPDPLRPQPGRDTGLDQGEIDIGIIDETNLPWRWPVATLPHVLLLGPTGGGKTNLLYVVVEGLSGRLPLVLVTVKKDVARLLTDPPILSRVYHFEELKLGLFEPPAGVCALLWSRTVIDIIAGTFDLMLSRAILLQCCDELHDLYERYSRQTGTRVYFTPQALLHRLQRVKYHKYVDSAIAAIETFCAGTDGVFEYSQGYPADILFTRSAVALAIPSIQNTKVARTVSEWLLEYLYAHLVYTGPDNGSPQMLLGLEDAHPLLSQANERNGIMPLSQRYLLIRQSGLRLLAVSQMPHDLAPTCLGQSGTIVLVGGLTHRADTMAVTAAFGMDASEHSRLQTPGRGDFVARENLGRYSRPFSGKVRLFPASTRVFSETDRLAIMHPFYHSLPFIPAVPLQQVDQTLSGMKPSAAVAVPARIPTGKPSSDALRLAADVLDHPFDFLSVRYQRLGLAGRIAQKAKDDLLTLQWVREHAIPRHGKSPVLLEPLTALCAALAKAMPAWGKGSYIHSFGQHVVADWLQRNGFTSIRTEHFFGSKAVDVTGVSSNGDLHGFEISVHLANLTDNIEKDLICQPRFGCLTAVCLSQSDVRQAHRMVAMAPGLSPYMARIRVQQLASFL